MTAENLNKARRYRWLIFILLAFGYILVYFHRLCPAVLAIDIMRDFNVGGALTGLLGAAYFYPYALMQLPAGLLSDSWGPRKTITIFFIVAFLGSIVLELESYERPSWRPLDTASLSPLRTQEGGTPWPR